jgi:hypothetical protein
MSEHLALPNVKDDDWATPARPGAEGPPGPADAASGIAAADNTASPISTTRRIV